MRFRSRLVIFGLLILLLQSSFSIPVAAERSRRICDPRVADTPDPSDNISESFRLTGAVSDRLTFDLEDLRALPQTTLVDSFLAGGGSVNAKFTGVLLSDLLGLPSNSSGAGPLIKGVDGERKNDILGYSVLVVGSDCYRAVFAMGEISPFFGGRPVLVSYAQGQAVDPGAPATGSLGTAGRDGFARINNPVDLRGGRRVSNIVEIRVIRPPSGLENRK